MSSGCGGDRREESPVFFLRKIGDAEGDHDKNADQRNVGVTIGHGSFSDLDQADDRDERSEEEEPSDRQVAAAAEFPDEGGDSEENGCRNQHTPRRQSVARVWIQWRETRRPEHVPQVHRVGVDRVRNSDRERKLCCAADSAAGLLSMHRDDGAAGRHQE